MDDEILKTVESMLGKDIKIVDCEKTSSVREEEVLLINGIPVQMEGEDGLAIKSALMTGQVPPCDLLNQLLYRAGILRQPVHLETSLSVKSSVIRKEEITVAKNGKILNERSSETQENNIYSSSCNEIWEPMDELGALKQIIPIPVDQCLLSGEGKDCGDAFLLAAPKQFTKLIQKIDRSTETSMKKEPFESQYDPRNSISHVRKPAALSTIVPSTSVASSLSLSSVASSSLNNSSTLAGSDCHARSDKNFAAYIDGGSFNNVVTANTKINFPKSVKDNDSKKLINCMSFDSGHDDFFNSLSQSNFLAAVTGASTNTCTNITSDETPETPTLHSNSISSCYDFFSSSDETDHHDKSFSCTPPSTPLIVQPTIFGTVASDQFSKENVNRKGQPQTGSSNGANSGNKSSDKIRNPHISQSLATGVSIGQPQQQYPPQNNSRHQKDHRQQQQQQSQDNSEENSLVYRDGNLISGPLDTLIQHMVPTSDYYPDRSYLFAFLLSARLFIRPHELLAKVCQLCNEQQKLSCPTSAHDSVGTAAYKDVVDYHHPTYQKSMNNDTQLHQHSHHSKSEKVASAGAGSTTADLTGYSHSANSGDQDSVRAFAQNFVRLLAEWIDTFPYDFRDERLMQHVRLMTRKCISIDSSLRKEVQTMLQDLLQRLTILEKYEEFLLSLNQGNNGIDGGSDHLVPNDTTIKNNMSTVTYAKPSVLTIQNNLHGSGNGDKISQNQSGGGNSTSLPHQLTTSSSASSASSLLSTGGSSGNNFVALDISTLCPNPTMLAHQLTHIELERLSYIGPEEFVQAFAKENPHLEQSFSDMKKTRNLESYVQWFNRLSYLVATEIVKYPKKKQRVRIVEYWIETARECFNIGNFNSLMAIIAGLNMSPISRLKKTWAKVQSAKFLVLEHQMDPSSNFNSYRSTLKAAMWRSAGATDERERIVIPFFSLLVKDLYFLNEGCSNKLATGHINFEKFWQLAKQVTEFIAWKQVTCPFEKLVTVIMFLQTSNILNENKLAIASFECEPPENNHEKDRYKSLKSEQQQQNSQSQSQHQQNQMQHQHHQQQQ